MAATGSPGAIVGVWAPWSGAWVAGLGTRQPAGAGGAVSTDQQFQATQVTRAMTCDVLYALVARGTVSLDDSVTEYVSGVADLSQVTLGQLCDGTAGIGSYSAQLLATWLSKPDRVWNPRELASYGLGLGRTAPGSVHRDSDASYALLGVALEHASGSTAAKLIDEYVADPLVADRHPAAGRRDGVSVLHARRLPLATGCRGRDRTAPHRSTSPSCRPRPASPTPES